ncbi:signal peptidase I [Celerinatantimonas sp. MCCC 1A17872]|uniref:signal peptidase I n=1 Tax=Celerinatantimonas sp. MCCC 1A17872 TaxID=3177514 RepID=UPI0038CBD8A5
MAAYFSIVLVVVTLLTGIVWALDRWVFGKQRQAKLQIAQNAAQGELPEEVSSQLLKEPGWIENCKSVFPVLLVVLILRSFLYEPFQIPSGSMKPTLLVGDFILVEKFAYGLKDPIFNDTLIPTGQPKRGDIIVFKYPRNPKLDYIKRVVGLPGDKVIYKDKQLTIVPKCEQDKCPAPIKVTRELLAQGQFHERGYPLDTYQEQLGKVSHRILINPYLADNPSTYFQQDGTDSTEFIVPDGEYFAMGDNRDNSEDSRYWGFVPAHNLVGRAVAVWISFEFNHSANSWLPSWVPTGVRFNRIGAIH